MIRKMLSAMTLFVSFATAASAAEPQLKALLIDGQNNHNWKSTSPLLKAALEASGRFTVDVLTSPPGKSPKAAWESFKPDFSKYAVVVSNYNGDMWPEDVAKAFEQYVSGGGGLVIVHAADNSFPQWAEYNKMIGLGGWGGRNEKSGPYIRIREGKIVRDESKGSGGGHGPAHEYVVETFKADHPIMAGIPAKWLHTRDELYSNMRGPAENMTLLAISKPAEGKGKSEYQPMLFTIDYGKGRVFHTMLGHDAISSKCVGFVVTLQRGTEWAATGKVTIPVPKDFPTAEKSMVWEPAVK